MTSRPVAIVWHAVGDVNRLAWWCPGCEDVHAVALDRWTWNGDRSAPTLSPSVLCTGNRRCHCFVKGGQIQFLSDCEHALAGRNVPMVAPPGWLADEEPSA